MRSPVRRRRRSIPYIKLVALPCLAPSGSICWQPVSLHHALTAVPTLLHGIFDLSLSGCWDGPLTASSLKLTARAFDVLHGPLSRDTPRILLGLKAAPELQGEPNPAIFPAPTAGRTHISQETSLPPVDSGPQPITEEEQPSLLAPWETSRAESAGPDIESLPVNPCLGFK